MKKKTKKRGKVKVWRGWGVFWRRGGELYKYFYDYEDAKAYVGTMWHFRVAKCEVHEFKGKQ